MITIWKYTIPIQDSFSIMIPKNASIKSLQTQFNDPTIWVVVDTNQPLEEKFFKLYGTGHDILEGYMNRKYIGTFQLDDGNYVYHLFEVNRT